MKQKIGFKEVFASGLFLVLAVVISLVSLRVIPDSPTKVIAQLQQASHTLWPQYDDDSPVLQTVPGTDNVPCQDGVDNDSDGLVDMLDPGCYAGRGAKTEVGIVSCTDSDNGLNYQTKGTLHLLENGVTRVSGVDACMTSNQLREYKCSGADFQNGIGLNTYTQTTCQNGCSNGICVTPPSSTLSISGSPVTVGTIAVASRITKVINVAYTGTSPSTQISFTATAPFSVMSSTCGTQTSASCTVTVGYIPTTIIAAGETGTLTTKYNNGVALQTLTTQLKGNGLTNDFTKVLIVYNTNSADSIAVKDYYIAKRPGAGLANVLGITTTVGENMDLSNFNSTVRDPIVNWMQANTAKGVKYIILMRDIPSRFSTNNGVAFNTYPPAPIGFTSWSTYLDSFKSVQTRLENAKKEIGIVTSTALSYTNVNLPNPAAYNPTNFPGTLALVTHMDMGSVDETKAYIDKLATVHAGMTTPNALISGTNAGIAGTTYYCEDSGNFIGTTVTSAADFCNALKTTIPASTIQIKTASEQAFSQANNVKGFVTWGTNGRDRNSNYAINGSINFTGNSNWFVTDTFESWNGIGHGSQPGRQGNFEDWHAANAFGGTNYSHTAVGSVGETHEPAPVFGAFGPSNSKFLIYWESGYNFADTAWATRRRTTFRMTGDPMIKI